MKNFLKLTILGSALTFFVSCDNSSDSTNDNTEMNLVKKVTFLTYPNNPTYNTRNVKRYQNFQVVSDSTFDYQNQFWYRTVMTTNGLTKTFKTYANTGEMTAHSEENYDALGRITGRHTYEPPSALYFTYVYNNDGTVSSKYFNEIDNETVTFRTFTKNAAGLIYKQNFSAYSVATGQVENYEYTANLENQTLLSINGVGSVPPFQYYPNPMPVNLLKSVDELNNEIVKGNELLYLGYNGNSYYKPSDNTVTTFNSSNYKTHILNTTSTQTTEVFYYYE